MRNLVDLETDKVVSSARARGRGAQEIKLNDGTTVTSGQVLAVIAEGLPPCPEQARPPSWRLQRRHHGQPVPSRRQRLPPGPMPPGPTRQRPS